MPPASDDKIDGVIAGLRAEWSLDFRRVEHVLRRLAAGAWVTVTELVEASGLSRRNVESVTAALDPWLDRSADRMRLRREAVTAVTPPVAAGDGPGPGEGGAGGTGAAARDVSGAGDLVARMEAFAAGLPAPLWRLDHVPATPATMMARARFLAGEYDLAGATVCCLGDHDLTSLALALVEPGARSLVVDVDDLILDHIRGVARTESFSVTTAFADLRLGYPPSLAGAADLVFTDPPYHPDGIRLFLERGIEALRRSDHARLVFCFGFGDRHLVRGVEVQRIVSALALSLEAVLPGFNRYRGAEAVGSRSSLYVCRPTSRTWTRSPGAAGAPTRIYSRGPAAAETQPPPALPGEVAAAVTAARRGANPVMVGAGSGTGDVPAVAARLAAGVTSPRPQPPPFGDVPVVFNLHPHYGASLVRILLLAVPSRVVIITPARSLTAAGRFDPADPIGRLVRSTYDVEILVDPPGGRDEPAVLALTRHDRAGEPATAPPATRLLARIVARPGAKAGNAWRDGLVALAREAGRAVTKNEARAVIAAAPVDQSVLGLRLWEQPLSTLRELALAIETSTGPIAG